LFKINALVGVWGCKYRIFFAHASFIFRDFSNLQS